MSGTGRYSLKELSDRTGVSPRTVRFYTAQGLLPQPLTRGRYAAYSDAHLNRLKLIDRLKGVFLPLNVVREQLNSLSDEQIAKAVSETAEGREHFAYLAGVRPRQELGVGIVNPSPQVGQQAAQLNPARVLIPMDSRDQPTSDSWRRFPVAPGIEIHARTGLPADTERNLELLIEAARQRIGTPRSPSRSSAPHAHPRNFSLVRHIDRGWGELAFEYWWETSDGSKPNEAGELESLAHCVLYEVTTYAGNDGQYVDGWYIPPEPPFAGWKFRDPTDGRTAEVGQECFVATHGEAWDRHKIAGSLLPPVEPAVFTITAVQTYRYYCDVCGRDEVIPGLRGGPHEIVRTFAPSPTPGLWRYTVEKHDFTAWMDVDESGFVSDSLGLDFGPW
jgi:DNA-binding transcriptional MerR regulator